MPHLIKVLAIIPLFYFFVGNRYLFYWKAGLIGMGIMLAADYTGFRLNLWHYQNGLITLWSFLPLPHILNIYFVSVIFVSWLPEDWSRRILYIIYFSVLSLAVEGAIYSAGGIIYPNWKIQYSFFLILGGLSLLAYLSDFVIKQHRQAL